MPSSAMTISRPSLLFWPDKSIVLTSSKEESSSASDFGARFGSIELSATPRTPKAGSLLSLDTSRIPFLGNKQIYRKVIEWFETWRPWQQRILLCGLTNRCSTNQLETLATTLEPIFHRDFVLKLKQRYPSASFKPLVTKSGRKKAKKGTKGKGKNRTTKEKTIVEQILPALTKESDYSQEDKAIYDDENAIYTTKQKEKSVEESVSLEDFASSIAELVVKSSLSDINAEMTGDKLANVTDAIGNVMLPVREKTSDSNSTNSDNKTTVSKVVPAFSYYRPKINKNSKLKKDESVISKSLPAEGMDMLKYGPVEWEELSTKNPTQHHNAWLRHKRPSNPPSAQTTKSLEDGHRHKSALSKTEITHEDFFRGDKYFTYGPYQAEMRTGQVHKPDLVDDIYVPIQKMYKSNKFFPEMPREGSIFVKPNSAKLKLHFKEQINQIWEWMSMWEDHEKLALLKEIIKLCNSGLITYLGQCLYQRLSDRHDINWLPDKLLLLVFSYLSVEDLDVASQVCRRWHYLTSVNELWIVKCHEYALHNGVPNVTRQIVENSSKKGKEVDWRLAFDEVKDIIEDAKLSIPVPREPSVEAATPEGMVKVYGKLVPLLHDRGSDSDVSSFRSVSRIEDEVEAFLPGLATKLVHESNKLKKSYRDMKRLKKEKEDQERLQKAMPQQPVEEENEQPSVEKTPSVESKNASRLTLRRARRTNSRLSAFSSESGLYDEIAETRAELEALKEEDKAQLPPKNLEEWVEQYADKEEQLDISLDVRHEITQAKPLLPDSAPSSTLLHSSMSDAPSKQKKKKDKNQKEDFISSVRCSKRLYGHMDSVTAMTSDRKRLISGSLDRSIRIWDIRTGNTIHKLIGHKGAVTCFAFDNQILYSGSWDSSVMVWDLVHFFRIHVLTGHKGTVSALVHDKDCVISGSHDGTVRIWSKDTYDCEKIIQIHTLHIMTMEYDGRLVYTGCSDGTIKVTSIQRAEVLQEFKGHDLPVHKILIQGDLLVSTNPSGQLWFWHKDKGKALAAIQAHSASVNAIKFVKGRFYTASNDMTIKEWDLQSLTCLRSLVGHRGAVNDILFQGDKLVSCDSTGAVRTWDFAIQLMQLGATGGEEGAIDHNVVDEEDLIKGHFKV